MADVTQVADGRAGDAPIAANTERAFDALVIRHGNRVIVRRD